MAKKTYVGVNNIARNVSKMYVGVNGVARRVKKAYVGVNGVARQFYRKIATSVTKISSGLDFSYGMDEAGTAQNENYVLFNGNKRPQGATSTEYTLRVNAFNKNLTRSIPTDLSATSTSDINLESCAGTQIGNYALMGKSNCINSYDTSLTRNVVYTINGSVFSMRPKASIANYAIFCSGEDTNWTFHPFDSALTHQSTITYIITTRLSLVDNGCASAFENKMYIFGGGDTNYRSISNTLTLTNEGSYSTFTNAKMRMMTGTTSKYCFCVGGMTTNGNYESGTSNGFAVDNVGTKTRITVSEAFSSGGGVASNDLFLVGGGTIGNFSYSNIKNKIYQFDNSLTRTILSNLDYRVEWNYGNAYWNGYFIFHNGRTKYSDDSNSFNASKANLYQEQ